MPALDPELLSRLLPTYIKTRESDLAKVYEALNNSDFLSLQKLGHKIKGSASTYGFEKTAEIALKFEHAAQAKDLESCSMLVEQMVALLFQA